MPQSKIGKLYPPENITIVTAPELNATVLSDLYNAGIYSLFVEGGGYTISQFIKQRLFNKIYQFVGPSLMGNGQGWSLELDIAEMKDRPLLKFTGAIPLGDDVLITAILKK